MAGSLVNAWEDEILDHLLGTTSSTMVSNTYVALFTADPTEAGLTTNEVPNTYSYARTATGTFSASSGGASDNDSEIAFPQASGGSWGTITYIMITETNTWQDASGIFWGQLTASKTINDGDQFKIAAGDLQVSID